MKKSVLLLLALVFVSGAKAQEENKTQTVGAAQETVDSLAAVVNALTAQVAQAEEDRTSEKIWRRKKYFYLGIGGTSLEMETPEGLIAPYKSQASFGLTFGKTFYLHKKPLAGLVKFGLDWTWMDLSYARYKKGSGFDMNGLLGNLGDYEDWDDWDDWDDEDEDLSDRLNVGMHQLEYGMGIGPSVTVTPFRPLGIDALNYVKVSAFFHWQPSYSAVINSEDGETNLNHGYCNFFKFGLGLSWKVLTIGYEHRWGSAKYNSQIFDDNELNSGDKMNHKTTNNRFVIGFRF